MQKILVCSKNQSRVLYSGSDLERAKKIAREVKGEATLRIYTLIDSEKGRIKLVTKEYIGGRSFCIKISHLEDATIADIIFKPKSLATSTSR